MKILSLRPASDEKVQLATLFNKCLMSAPYQIGNESDAHYGRVPKFIVNSLIVIPEESNISNNFPISPDKACFLNTWVTMYNADVYEIHFEDMVSQYIRTAKGFESKNNRPNKAGRPKHKYLFISEGEKK